jgi:zinc/manganese transport system substrate-binding protein
MQRRRLLTGLAATALAGPACAGAAINIVAAENMYGGIATQLAGNLATVTSILNNPNEDPHLFSAAPSIARALANADIVIVNGADYDPWMAPLLAATAAPRRIVITIADLLGRKPGDNPHLWYDPNAIPALIPKLVAALIAKDPAHAALYEANGAKLLAALAPLRARMAQMREKYAGLPVTATEPVFDLMASALGLNVLNMSFQLAVMNGTEPSPRDVGTFEDDLKNHKVRALFYNSQVTDDLTTTLLTIARQSGIPVIGMTETEPAGFTYQQWMTSGLNGVDQALGTQ